MKVVWHLPRIEFSFPDKTRPQTGNMHALNTVRASSSHAYLLLPFTYPEFADLVGTANSPKIGK